MYEFLGITLVLAMLLTVNAVATAAATGLWYLLRRPLLHCSARTRAELLFVMRIGPPTISILWTIAFIIPSYLVYEPQSTDEFVSLKLGTLCNDLSGWCWLCNLARHSFVMGHSFIVKDVVG
jgi:hypothetical protein